MGCGNSSEALSPDQLDALSKTGHSTGELCGKLTQREWNNLTFETKRFIAEIDEERKAGKVQFDSITLKEEDGLNGNYAGECDAKGNARGEGTFIEAKTNKEYKGTFRDNKLFGYCAFAAKEGKEPKYYRIGEIKENVWIGKRTDYYGSGKITNKIYTKKV